MPDPYSPATSDVHAAEVRGVLLDIDGTLVDSNLAHARAWRDALSESGRDIDLETLRRSIGMGSDQMLPKLVAIEKESDEGRALCDRCGAFFTERYLEGIRPIPGARALVERILERGLKVGVASSAAPEKAGRLLEIANVTDLLEAVATSADAARSKPEPDILFAAAAKLGIPPAEAFLLGDTPYDIEAGRRAGLRGVIAVRSGGWSDAELTGAVAVYADAADLLARYDDSPLGTAAPVGG